MKPWKCLNHFVNHFALTIVQKSASQIQHEVKPLMHLSITLEEDI